MLDQMAFLSTLTTPAKEAPFALKKMQVIDGLASIGCVCELLKFLLRSLIMSVTELAVCRMRLSLTSHENDTVCEGPRMRPLGLVW